MLNLPHRRTLLAGTFDLRSIPGLQLLLDDQSSMSISSGESISNWSDRSGNNNNLSQATASAQPTRQISAQNGKNTVRFTGANSQYFNLTSALAGDAPFTAISVARRAGPSGSNQVITLGQNTSTGRSPIFWYTDAIIYTYSGASGRTFTGQSQTDSGYNIVTAQTINATSANIYFNGMAQTVTSVSFSTFTNWNRFGYTGTAPYIANCEIAAFAFWSRALDLGEIQKVERFLKTYWATP